MYIFLVIMYFSNDSFLLSFKGCPWKAVKWLSSDLKFNNLSVTFSKPSQERTVLYFFLPQVVSSFLQKAWCSKKIHFTNLFKSRVCELSTKDATSDVDVFIQSMFYQLYIFQIIFYDANQVAKAFLLLFQMLEGIKKVSIHY